MESTEIEEISKKDFSEFSKDDTILGKIKRHKFILIIGGISLVLIIVVIILVTQLSKNKNDGSKEGVATESIEIDGKKIEYKTSYLIKEDKVIDSGEFSSNGDKETVFLVINGATLEIKNAKINKLSSSTKQQRNLKEEPFNNEDESDVPPDKPDGSDKQPPDGSDSERPDPPPGGESGESAPPGGDSDNYSFYGINSAIVVIGKGSKAIIENVNVYTDSYGSNAVVAVNQGEIEIKNSTIETKDSSSRGLHATYQGKITANNVQIKTIGGSCANLATDRGEGKVIAYNMKLSTAGAGSPLIYSTGDIQVYDSTGESSGAQIAVVEGKNSAKITNCNFTCTGAGNRGDVDIAGVMVYQSMSGDASVGEGSFYSTNSKLEIIKSSKYYSSAPMIFITNTKATIFIDNTNINFGSGIFMDVRGTSEWGKEGDNGGEVTFTAIKNNLFGLIKADNISSIDFYRDEKIKNITYEESNNIKVHDYTG